MKIEASEKLMNLITIVSDLALKGCGLNAMAQVRELENCLKEAMENKELESSETE